MRFDDMKNYVKPEMLYPHSARMKKDIETFFDAKGHVPRVGVCGISVYNEICKKPYGYIIVLNCIDCDFRFNGVMFHVDNKFSTEILLGE